MNEVYNWLIKHKSELMNKFIFKMIPNRRDSEDFYQDLFLIMSNKDELKLQAILERSTDKNNEMMRYVYIIIKNNLRSKNSRYYYTYRKPIGSDYDEIKEECGSIDSKDKFILLEEIEKDYGILMDKINKYFDLELKSNPKMFYDKSIFDMYYKQDNTYRSLGSILDIPSTSIFNTVKKTKNKILKVFKEDIENINAKLIYYYNYDDN
jgi:hypothetical protein